MPREITTTGVRVNKWLRLLHAALFSLNCSLITEAVVLAWRPDYLLRFSVIIFTNRYGRWLRMPGVTETQEFAEYLLWLTMAAAIFVVLGLFAELWLTHILLSTVAGLIAIAFLPFAAFCLGSSPDQFLSVRAVHSLPFEVLLVLLLAFAYMRRRWTILGPYLFSCVLALHFAIWVWASWPEFRPGPGVFWVNGAGWFWHFRQASPLLGPLLGFCSSLVWAVYVRWNRGRLVRSEPSSAIRVSVP